VNGNWGEWGQFNQCSVTCGTGSQTRQRVCNNPPPANGGTSCPGEALETQECNTQICPVNGNWGAWSNFGACSEDCGTGSRSRSRVCDDPEPAFGGTSCPGLATEQEPCNTQPCPVHGNWGSWSNYSECSETCGGGVQNRSRDCDDPKPINGGDICPGNDSETQNCNTDPCPATPSGARDTEASMCLVLVATGVAMMHVIQAHRG